GGPLQTPLEWMLALVLRPRRNRDCHATAGKAFCDGRPDAAARARYQRHTHGHGEQRISVYRNRLRSATARDTSLCLRLRQPFRMDSRAVAATRRRWPTPPVWASADVTAASS